MRRNWIVVIGVLFLLSSFQGFAGADTAGAIDQLLKDPHLKHSLIGIYALSLKSGQPVYAYNADIAMIPASNNKLFTTAAALDLLGPDYTYTTKLMCQGEIQQGILKGHLIIVGSGDPTISGRFNDGDVTQTLREWVQAVKDKGIRRVEGYVIGDDDLWNDDDYAWSWSWASAGEWYQAPSSALSFNDNCVDLKWKAGKEVGESATYELHPDTRYLLFKNLATTKKKGSGSDRYYDRSMYSREVKITGGLDINQTGKVDSASVDNPTRYFATVFCELLKEAGVEVVEGPADIDDFNDKSIFRNKGKLIASHKSPPMSEIIHVINKRSQNFYAEQVLRTLGQQFKKEGGYSAGTDVVTEFLKKHKIEMGGFNMTDGSGLAWSNHTSPKTLVELLRFMHHHKNADVYVDSLPVGGGSDGSLRARFDETDTQKRIQSRIKGKTGLISMTRTLSGYLTTDSGDELAYSVMFNNYTNRSTLTWIDRIVTLLATEGQSR